MHQVSTTMHLGGRLVVPSLMREALHLQVGDRVLLRVEDGELRVIPQAKAIRRALSNNELNVPFKKVV